ncbi:YecA/YgfB family protein [Phytohalomonas tamaricis]|uniref:YecA/YgfB family protein n=1 Tax=Phytohalomonas tamaricis TaxID=2081032 RepID=UPI000D0B4D2A|nr:YecA family protein [Phytohalomonas tamaricis]
MADTAPLTHPLLDDEALEALDEFLDSDRVDGEALDIFGAHGFLVALAIAPETVDSAVWIPVLFNGEPEFNDDAERDYILGTLETIRSSAVEAFEQGHLPELPFTLEFTADDEEALEETPIAIWCAGFMEGVFLNESSWFGTYEEHAAQLLLPFMALSGLFEEEDPDLAELIQSSQEASRLAQQLPELTLDLYLLYRTPPETKGPPPAKKSARGRRGNKR